MITKKFISVLVIMLVGSGFLFAQDYKYIGAAKCKMCHNKPNKGEQFNKWSKLKHANAMKSLVSQKAIDYAKANGIADASKEAKCLKCHSTASTVPAKLNAGIKPTEGVSCESCHGPGSAYKAVSVMKNQKLAIQKGLIVPDEALCKKCHNDENPFFQGFDYAAALKTIAHPDPTLQ